MKTNIPTAFFCALLASLTLILSDAQANEEPKSPADAKADAKAETKADVELTLAEAGKIPTMTAKRFRTLSPQLNEGDIIKLKFNGRSRYHRDLPNDFFEIEVYDDQYNSIYVRVPNSVRVWFMKIQEYSSSGGKVYHVYGKVCPVSPPRKGWENMDDGGKRLELIGTELKQSFNKATIRWTGQTN